MAVTLIAKNQTGVALTLSQLSVPNNELPASPATVTLTDFATVNEIQDDVELIAHITADDVIISDCSDSRRTNTGRGAGRFSHYEPLSEQFCFCQRILR